MSLCMTSQPFTDSINSLVRSASVTQYLNERGHVIFCDHGCGRIIYLCPMVGSKGLFITQAHPSLSPSLCVMYA